MAQSNKTPSGYRDEHGRFTDKGASYYGRLGGEASRDARRKRQKKSQNNSKMRENMDSDFNDE